MARNKSQGSKAAERRTWKTVDSRGVMARLSGVFKLPNLDRAVIFARWPEIVGKGFAKVSQPQRISGNKLFVRVVDNSWAADMRQNYDEILTNIEEKCGDSRIKKLHFVIGPIDGALRIPEAPPPLSDEEVETADIDAELARTKLADHPETRDLMARVWANGRRLAKRRRKEQS